MADTIVAPQVYYFDTSYRLPPPGPESQFEANIVLQTLHEWQELLDNITTLEEVLTTSEFFIVEWRCF